MPDGAYTSAVHAAAFEFIAVGADWEAGVPAGVALQVEVRASGDGAKWSDWYALPEIDGGPGPDKATGTDLGFLSGRYLQVRLSADGGDAPARIRSLTLTYLDTRDGPTADEAAAAASLEGLAEGEPTIISRAGWGANESYRFQNGVEVWPPEYMRPQGLVVHHSGPPEPSNQDPAAWIRAIYYYHAITKGWGDIGYNFVVDKQGRLYQGRYPGTPPAEQVVRGGHALEFNCCTLGLVVLGDYHTISWPSSASIQGLVDIGAWLAASFSIDPLGRSFIVDKTVYNISGHRDVNLNHTACPGDRLYPYLPELRQRTWDALQAEPTTTPTPTPTLIPIPTPILLPTPTLPRPGECGDRVANGDFEIDNGTWTRNRAYYTTFDRHAGVRSLFVGLLGSDPNINAYASAYQEVFVPADAARIELSFWYRPYSEDTVGDLQLVRIFDRATSILLPGDGGNFTSNSNTWEQRTYDLTYALTAYRGRSLTLYFGVVNDGANGKTYMRLDDVAFITCRIPVSTPTATPTFTRTPTPTATPCNGVCPSPTPTSTPTRTRTPPPIGTYRLYLPVLPAEDLLFPTR